MSPPRRPVLDSATLERAVKRLRKIAGQERGQKRGHEALDRRAMRLADALNALADSLAADDDSRDDRSGNATSSLNNEGM